jgi:hypothetical protein
MRIAAFVIFLFSCFNLIAQGNLQFNQVILVSDQPMTVPQGKVWKIENIIYDAVSYYQPSSGTGGACPPCNGSSTMWTSFTMQQCQVAGTTPIIVNGTKSGLGNTGAPLWLPSGSTLAGDIKTCSNSSGSYSNSCICPAPSVTAKTYISVIEFNIVP